MTPISDNGNTVLSFPLPITSVILANTNLQPPFRVLTPDLWRAAIWRNNVAVIDAPFYAAVQQTDMAAVLLTMSNFRGHDIYKVFVGDTIVQGIQGEPATAFTLVNSAAVRTLRDMLSSASFYDSLSQGGPEVTVTCNSITMSKKLAALGIADVLAVQVKTIDRQRTHTVVYDPQQDIYCYRVIIG